MAVARTYNGDVFDRLRRLVTRAPERFPELPAITLAPIGIVRNGEKDVPADGWDEVTSNVVIRPELEEALLGLDGWSHIVVLFWPHLVPDEVRGSKHQLHPRDDESNPLQGVLATRAQIRFNPILSSAVKLLGVKGNIVRVRGLDALDGTPVLDVKPYIPHFDAVPEAEVPDWVLRYQQED